jgi:three-Cys-motif partner protein
MGLGVMLKAADGLRARDAGQWAETKLAFLDEFCPAAIQATARKRQRYYVDLFAGPGVNVARDSGGREFEGSPLRVLKYAGLQTPDLSFTHAVFINQSRLDHRALGIRVARTVAAGDSRVREGRIQLVQGDANVKVGEVLQDVPKKAYLFMFADMEAPRQWPWRSMERVRSFGHESIDLYVLFPLDMAIMRLMSYQQRHTERYARSLTDFFGTDEWRRLAELRITEAHSAKLRHGLTDLYAAQLRRLWCEVGSIVDVFYRGRQRLYTMMFATDHAVGARIASWIRKRQLPGQGELFGEAP